MRSLFTLALLPLLAACGEAVDPLSDALPEPFAIYGVLDGGAGAHRIRVEAVRRAPDRPATVETGVTATLVDEALGTTTAGRPETIRLPDGTEARAFAFAVALVPGARYRLALRAPDGRAADAATTVPPARPADVLDARRDSARRDTQGIVWAGLGAAPARVLVGYRLLPNNSLTDSTLARDTTVVTVEASADGPAAGGWRTAVRYTQDGDALYAGLGRPRTDRSFRLVGVAVEIRERSAEWAFGGPGAPPNLTGAYGFFGSVGVSRVRFVPPRSVVEALGFRV